MELNTQIQIEVLSRITAGARPTDVLRKDIAEAFKVDGKRVDQAMALCALVQRVTSNGGHHIRYRLAD
jgi:hypothetical protein